jgi:hypothetical protein
MDMATLEASKGVYFLTRGPELLEDQFGALEQSGAGLRQGHRPMRALEQGRAQLGFEQLHLLRNRGLTDRQVVGCASEAAEPGNTYEVLELSQVDTGESSVV